MTKMEELTTLEEQTYIRRFSQRIIKERSGNYKPLKRSHDGTLIYPDSSGAVSNRGAKLLQGSELVARDNLNSNSIVEDIVYYNGSEHRLLQRLHKRMKFFPEERKPTAEEEEEIEQVDLNTLVDVREILTPIASLGDVANRSSVARTFRNNILQNLSLQTIFMIEKEQSSVIRYSKILEVFLGDNPEPLYERNLKLKTYDHNLALPDEENDTEAVEPIDDQTVTDQNKKDEKLDANNDNTIDSDDDDKTNDDTDIADEDIPDQDPFFALPSISNTDGLKSLLQDVESVESTEQMETTRQMAQIALQRNQEFIRNLKKIRDFMHKATRIRERILAWSKEYAGIPEDGVTVPNALRVVKRGLISATTNRSMGKQEEDSSSFMEDYEE